MRKLWFRRKAVSTMIAGIIVLTLFLTALGAMMLITQRFDTYEQTAAKMSLSDIQRFSENLMFNYPGITVPGTPTSCSGAAGCTQYALNMTNAANIGTQIVRIYINSTFTGCVSICILDPATSPAAFRFRSADRYINPSETYHLLIFWLPNTDTISNQVQNTINAVTARGRIFTLQFPIPAIGGSIPSSSGLLSLGCLAIKVEQLLVTYTSRDRIQPPMPITGAWKFPYKTYLILYIKVSNICGAPIKLLDRSGFTAIRYTGSGAGSMKAFYISSPMSLSYCGSYFSGTLCVPTTAGNQYPINNGGIQAYNSSQTSYPGDTCPGTDPCYVIPASFSRGTPGLPMYVLFSATNIAGNSANSFSSPASGETGNLYVGFLAMYWQCTNGSDPTCAPNYTFGVTLPFITLSTFAGP